jgi:ABC-2 type transport system ATP-binding protein
MQRIDGLHHFLMFDHDDDFATWLRTQGAREVHAMPVSLDRAVNAFLAVGHKTPDRNPSP